VTFEGHDPEGPVIRDKRRIDPLTGEVREPSTAAAPGPSGSGGEARSSAAAHRSGGSTDESVEGASEIEVALAERTADLQRLQAEYVNYKRRVDRDREVTRESAVANVLTQLLPVLDDIGRAREHDELTGGFRAVAESLERTVAGLGLVTYGKAGDPFDPRIHEALMHTYSDDVFGPVCEAVLQVGYRLGDRILRPARVAVAEPATADVPDAAPAESAAAATGEIGEAAEADRSSDATTTASYPSDGDDVEND
jgi:molecular chaperone GrpE